MPSRALEVVVGMFICVGVAAIFVLTFRVASLDNVGGKEGTYTVLGDFQNIGGLKVGSAVTMAGVKIGRVADIHMNEQTFQAELTLEISKRYDQIPEDSSAKILTSGLLGDQYIGLEPGGMPDYLKDGDHLMLTQDALVLENLIGQFVSQAGGGSKDDGAKGGGSADNAKLIDAINHLADAIQKRAAEGASQ